MVSSRCAAVSAAILLCSTSANYASAAIEELTPADRPEAPALVIDGKTVTNTEITSFVRQLEITEGQRFGSKEEVVNEFVLTRLAEKIPSTASLNIQPLPDTPSQYDLVSQRGLLKRELRERLGKDVTVPREDMEKWYEANVGRYSKPERVHAWHLFLETSEDNESSSPEKVKSRLNELKAQIDAGTSFSQMAEQHSEAASGKAGGEIGVITRRMPIGPLSKPMNIELENAFFSLPVGKVSDIVDTRHGMHLLYVTDKETTQTPAIEDLLTSGILPGVLAQDRLTSEIKGIIADTVERYNGKPLPNPDQTEQLTTDTVAFTFDGKNFTIGHLNMMFGPRFTSYLESSKDESQMLRELMKQALEDEAMVRAAIDKGVANDPRIAKELQDLVEREKATRRINAIVEAEARVTPEMVQQRYDEVKDELRQPEARGKVLLIKTTETSGTAEQAKAREYARRKADEIRAKMETEGFDKVADQLKLDSTVQTELMDATEHVIGQSTETAHRMFDQAITGITADTGLGQVVPLGTSFAIANLEKRLPGDPIPLETVRSRLESMIRNEAFTKSRENMVRRLEEAGLVKYLPGAAEFGKPVGSSDSATTSTSND